LSPVFSRWSYQLCPVIAHRLLCRKGGATSTDAGKWLTKQAKLQDKYVAVVLPRCFRMRLFRRSKCSFVLPGCNKPAFSSSVIAPWTAPGSRLVNFSTSVMRTTWHVRPPAARNTADKTTVATESSRIMLLQSDRKGGWVEKKRPSSPRQRRRSLAALSPATHRKRCRSAAIAAHAGRDADYFTATAQARLRSRSANIIRSRATGKMAYAIKSHGTARCGPERAIA
jgi:hypothetical protein